MDVALASTLLMVFNIFLFCGEQVKFKFANFSVEFRRIKSCSNYKFSN